MGSAIAFDTLEYSKKLISVGFTEQQAETHIEILKAIMVDRLATKEDVVDLKRDIKELELRMATKDDIADVKRDMKELETELKRDMKEMELRMVIKMGAMMTVCIAIVAALVKLL